MPHEIPSNSAHELLGFWIAWIRRNSASSKVFQEFASFIEE